jgi:2-dehydro-3-deoxygluconokinase
MGEPMLEFNQQPSPDGRRLYLEGFGGDTSNAAIAAARQGASAAYVTGIGRDAAGERFLELWRQEGVDTSGVTIADHSATGIYFVMHSDAGHRFLYYRDGSAASRIGPENVPESLFSNAKIAYFSGISQAISASASDAVFHAMALTRAGGGLIAYDTNYRPRLWPPARAAAVIHAAIARADIALPGMDDAKALTGLDDPDAIADFYLRLGPPLVVLKMGAAGAMVATPDHRTLIPPHPCTPVDASGAGDTFGGSFAARLLAGDAAVPAARYAGTAAALKTEGYGAVAPIPHAARVREAMRC